MTEKMVWVELDGLHAVRIFRTLKSMVHARLFDAKLSDDKIAHISYRFAVGEIRHMIWERTGGGCEFCNKPITEESMHLHEKTHRGQGGEISLTNSVGICFECHHEEHSDREPKWSINV